MSSAFDPTSLSNATLSNGDLTATRTSTSTGGAQSTDYKNSGKFYFEVTVGASHGSTDSIGVMASSYGYGALTNGNAGAGSGVWLGGGSIVNNGGTVGSVGGAANAAGSVICVAHDAGNGRVWYRLNGGSWNNSGTADPATNTGGINLLAAQYAPVVGFSPFGSPTVGDNFTANFGASAFAYSVPSGFTAGWPGSGGGPAFVIGGGVGGAGCVIGS
ncbi:MULTISPECIES: SPRY domain-containing protein [Bradyrhizobium]|uniref:hypothetical protein n=1 Tax=Bradyrhizobium elkanii TaxID=29448 RepID=UPI002714BC41|nr:hypothetical protein [Bradyrhizobium elkanii]WLA47297.1 hypothetical protein QIH80_37340 [Bradyrhizobium elkanii]WLB82407.1 hypothetical protein QIH83_07435 [Bradyrhizobium elkanii]